MMQRATAGLYARPLRKVPDDTLGALRRAQVTETDEVVRETLGTLLCSADIHLAFATLAAALITLNQFRRFC